MDIRFHQSAKEIGEKTWQKLANTDDPFLSYHFFNALEFSPVVDRDGATETKQHSMLAACCEKTGWQPYHAVIYDNDQPVALLPNYIKSHSYGEYIFDWAWANAYQDYHRNYYPKLLSAVPFSPVTGKRLLMANQQNRDNCIDLLTRTISETCSDQSFSSFHLLFPDQAISDLFAEKHFTQRHSFQYHWFNQLPEGGMFSDFDDFVARFKSRKRKALLKERRNIAAANIRFMRLTGASIEPSHWDIFYRFYQNTYAKRSGHGGYLPKSFFHYLGRHLADQILLVFAIDDGQVVAGALNLFSSSTLYGRYWGCLREADFLHFETCYYQGIEFCIERSLEKFDAGAQGEHKIQRGFRPTATWSNHWIAEPAFRRAIDQFIRQEKAHNIAYMKACEEHLPFKEMLCTA